MISIIAIDNVYTVRVILETCFRGKITVIQNSIYMSYPRYGSYRINCFNSGHVVMENLFTRPQKLFTSIDPYHSDLMNWISHIYPFETKQKL